MRSASSPPTIQHPLPPERSAAGKAARKLAPRASHGEWRPSEDRRDVVEVLDEQDRTRVPDLVPIRYGRMLASAFTFYRGAAAIMAMDLAKTPQSRLQVQLCGDAHLSNFGIFAAPDRSLVFDLNDFDETHPGPWEWDVKRLAASFAIAARDREFSSEEGRAAVLKSVESYRTAMRAFAGLGNLDVWYARLSIDEILRRMEGRVRAKRLKEAEVDFGKAKRKNSMRAFDKLSHLVDGERRIISDPPLIVPLEDLVSGQEREDFVTSIKDLLDRYRDSLNGDRQELFDGYRYVDLAQKVVGVGSVGTRAWIVMMTGRDDDDPLFLQCKEAQESVLEKYTEPSEFKNHGERVVEGQLLMQAASDVLLGWLPATGIDGAERDFYVRQLWDGKRSIDVDGLLPTGLTFYAQACGWTLARAHARSGDRIAISSYLGKGDVFDNAIADFAKAYADQNEHDYAAVQDAVKAGRIEARSDVV